MGNSSLSSIMKGVGGCVGKATIIMDTENYKAECYRQLNDPKFYKRLPKDITRQVED